MSRTPTPLSTPLVWQWLRKRRRTQEDGVVMAFNYCPHCGHRVYQHGKDGCEHVEIVGHIVRFTSAGWTLKHPLSERENDRLFDCTVNVRLSAIAARTAPKPGEYAIVDDGDGGWIWMPPDSVRQQCDCEISIHQLSLVTHQ